jgi:hypothetical protein
MLPDNYEKRPGIDAHKGELSSPQERVALSATQDHENIEKKGKLFFC